MSDDFFREKKGWSKYKDFVLDHYLTPYLEKVKRLNRPILLVDCCAGPGMFDDGSEGSPIIISKHIEVLYEKDFDIQGLFLEKKKKFFAVLRQNMRPYEAFTQTIHTDFTNYLDHVKQFAKSSTVFLYVDPYGIRELPFSELAEIYKSIVEYKSSVEVLLNFNSPALVRCGLAALKMDTAALDVDSDEESVLELLGAATAMAPSEVDEIAGGRYWRDILSDPTISFIEKEEAISEAYVMKMNNYFQWVCSFPIQKNYGQLPKYRLIYGTRHQDGIMLMNDTMYKAREHFLDEEFATGKLFDLRPPAESKNLSVFTSRLFEIVRDNEPISRRNLKLEGMQEFFCRYNGSDYNQVVSKLLKGGEGLKLYAHSGKTRINDDELLSTKPFA